MQHVSEGIDTHGIPIERFQYADVILVKRVTDSDRGDDDVVYESFSGKFVASSGGITYTLDNARNLTRHDSFINPAGFMEDIVSLRFAPSGLVRDCYNDAKGEYHSIPGV